MSTAMLNKILKEMVGDDMFDGVVISLPDGLPLATQSRDPSMEKTIAAISSMLADTAIRAKSDLNLSGELEYMKIVYEDKVIICRNVVAGSVSYLLAGLANKPQSEDIDKYLHQLIDWACENSKPILEKLAKI